MANDRYKILYEGEILYTNLSEEEYFNIMEDLSVKFYQTGSPHPENLKTEIIGE